NMGAALGLYLSLTSFGKQVSVASPADPLVEISSLVGIDKVKKQFQGEGNTLVVSFPYSGDNIEKGSYTVENGYLNIIVRAGEKGLDFDDKDVIYRKEGADAPKLLFVIGTPRITDLGDLFNPEAMKDTIIINIDNKRDNQGFGEVIIVSPGFSSVSEQITELLISLSLPIDSDSAQNLLNGIAFATSNFQDPNTSYKAFEVAGLLMQKGAVRKKKEDQFVQPDTFGYDASEPKKQLDTNSYRPKAQQKPISQFTENITSNQRQQGGNQLQPQRSINSSQAQQPFIPQAPAAPRIVSDDQPAAEPPADWLTPKVYKGSTNL
ncbi:MAG: hypothetical protein Q7S79_01490, partial [bacterium]|nr:hypothetical protein [bacterium]